MKPSALRIDNECPKAFQIFLRANSIDFYLILPNNPRINQANKAIDTWKFYFLAGVSGVDPNVPMHLWCRLLPQATQTLNLLHRSQINTRLSAEAQLNRVFDYN